MDPFLYVYILFSFYLLLIFLMNKLLFDKKKLFAQCLTSLSRIFDSFKYVTIAVNRCTILHYARHIKPFSKKGALSCLTCCDTRAQFSPFHQKVQLNLVASFASKGLWKPFFISVPRNIKICRHYYILISKLKMRDFPAICLLF